MKRQMLVACGAIIVGTVAAIVHGTVWPAIVIAHGGGLDSQGCHNDRQRGGYHCHRGPLAGESFASAAAAVAAMRARSAPLTAPKAPSVTTAEAVPLLATAAPTSASSSQISGLFDSFNRQTRLLALKDALGASFQFSVRDDTAVGVGERADDYFEMHPSTLPWKVGQQIMVTWRPSADRQKRVAISVR